MMTRSRVQRGFTLVELIIVIVLLGIMGTFAFSYIGFGAQIYRDTSEREQLVSQSRFAMERLTLELTKALPRSARVSADQLCLEYMPIISAGQYLELPQAAGDSTPVRVITPLVDDLNSLIDHYLVVFAANTNFVYGSSDERRKTISAISPGTGDHDSIIEIDTAVVEFFTGSSPAQRYYITGSPVSWCYQPSTQQLWRFSDYGLLVNAPSLGVLQASVIARVEMMADGMTNQLTTSAPQLPFIVDDATLLRTSLIQLDWRFARPNSGEPLQLLQEVHVANVP